MLHQKDARFDTACVLVVEIKLFSYPLQVHIKLPRRSESLDLDSSGSGFYAPDRDDETLTDDEDVTVRNHDETIRLDFSCDYTFSGLPVSTVIDINYFL